MVLWISPVVMQNLPSKWPQTSPELASELFHVTSGAMFQRSFKGDTIAVYVGLRTMVVHGTKLL